MVPIRLAEVGEREEALAELQIRLGEATDSAGIDGLKRDMQEIGLGNLLESFDVDAPARGIWGRPDDFEGLVVSSPKHGIPILISRQRHSDSVLRRVSRGTDLWFQAREGRGSRVLLRTSMRRNLSKSPRECMEVAAAYAAFFSDSGSQRHRSHRVILSRLLLRLCLRSRVHGFQTLCQLCDFILEPFLLAWVGAVHMLELRVAQFSHKDQFFV